MSDETIQRNVGAWDPRALARTPLGESLSARKKVKNTFALHQLPKKNIMVTLIR